MKIKLGIRELIKYRAIWREINLPKINGTISYVGESFDEEILKPTLKSLASYMVRKKIKVSDFFDIAREEILELHGNQSVSLINSYEKNLPSYLAKQKAISFVDELTSRNQEIEPYLLLKNAYSLATKDGFFDKEMFKECMRGMFFGNLRSFLYFSDDFLNQFAHDLNKLANLVERDGISPRAGKLYQNLVKVVATIITATFASLSGANPLLVAGLAVSGGVIGHFIVKFNKERLNTTQVDKAMDKLLSGLTKYLPVDRKFIYHYNVDDARARSKKIVDSLKPSNTFALRTEAERAASVNSKKER